MANATGLEPESFQSYHLNRRNHPKYPRTLVEFFNEIDPLQPLATDRCWGASCNTSQRQAFDRQLALCKPSSQAFISRSTSISLVRYT